MTLDLRQIKIRLQLRPYCVKHVPKTIQLRVYDQRSSCQTREEGHAQHQQIEGRIHCLHQYVESRRRSAQ